MSLLLPWLEPGSLAFPDTATALHSPNGLLAAGGDLSPERLHAAYRHGIFPWFSDDQPILWWAPDPRLVLFPDELHVSRSLAKFLRHTPFTLSTDQAFAAVLAGCAAPRPGSDGTWLGEEMQDAYCALHALGHAHSVEVWQDGELVGGLYGVALDGIFFGESMFSRRSNASRAALVWLTRHLAALEYRLIDCQVPTDHLASMGARLIPREEFNRYLPAIADISRPARWPIQ